MLCVLAANVFTDSVFFRRVRVALRSDKSSRCYWSVRDKNGVLSSVSLPSLDWGEREDNDDRNGRAIYLDPGPGPVTLSHSLVACRGGVTSLTKCLLLLTTVFLGTQLGPQGAQSTGLLCRQDWSLITALRIFAPLKRLYPFSLRLRDRREGITSSLLKDNTHPIMDSFLHSIVLS